jgi:tetratricopeptide (TPR) repeat protein
MMRNAMTRAIAFTGLGFAMAVATAAEQEPQTGTRLDSRGARPVSMQINETSTIAEIQRKLGAGETDEAVALARRYVESFDRTLHVSFEEVLPARYFALNALCVALTQSGEGDEAAEACSEAIAMLPQRWTAINNRGTARFVAERYGEALADYRLALRVAPADPAIEATIEHNIALAVRQQQESRLPLGEP